MLERVRAVTPNGTHLAVFPIPRADVAAAGTHQPHDAYFFARSVYCQTQCVKRNSDGVKNKNKNYGKPNWASSVGDALKLNESLMNFRIVVINLVNYLGLARGKRRL